MTAGVASTQAIDWNRNGVSIDKISFPLGSKIGDNTLFIAPECADCRALLELSMANLSNNLNIVLLASTQAGNHDNALVWCSKDRVKGLTDVYIKKIKPSTSDINSGCDQFGLMLADQAACVFAVRAGF